MIGRYLSHPLLHPIVHPLMQLEPREARLIFLSVMFLVLSMFAAFVGKPLYHRFVDTAAELEGLQALVEMPAEVGLHPLEAEVEGLLVQLKGDLKNLPARQLESHMVAAFQSASWQHDVTLVTIEPVPVTVELPYQELTFRLELEGSYAGLDNWVQMVSGQLGYVVFNEYMLKVKTPGKEPVLSARVELSAYRMQEMPAG